MSATLRATLSSCWRGNTIALTLHTGVLSKTFAIKSCRNPARHIFSWLPGEVVGLHTGVLTKTFVMSVLYLKNELSCGLGAINGDDVSMAGDHGSQRVRFPVSLPSLQLARFPVSLRTRGQLACLSVSLRTGRRPHPPIQSRSSICPHSSSYSH